MTESKVTKTDPDDQPACPPDARPSGPPREAGGTTGEGNLAPMQANRTGGATGGVGAGDEGEQRPARAGTVPPDA
jgi:hypothetical protein